MLVRLLMYLVFYLLVSPVALLSRAFGADPLRLKPDPGASSYWVHRAPQGAENERMHLQR